VAREPDAPLLVRDEVRDLGLRQDEPVDRRAGVLDEQAPGVGQLRAAAGAGDQRSADLGLERGEVLRDRGLREGQRVGRRRSANRGPQSRTATAGAGGHT
jgi:hypothetical protein